ncbi:uncharacterized protein LAESUDRAFT_719458 [Laetiporus sulphureus 93-53]|uniref:Uncharacterized protein n=1 Tax=Laetiporus sulphureus 93-53 TaxID=1314785 RepID=A0A165IIV4_9APHY|nr:uncharacterized protein LAESUDRAFT_719458 [Laetiporus sulphureus 93-53]KZT13139.1 hypothetical protein LAESUDRAFT_719458 [Laetiporus sulphureus 93-53]
MTAVSVQQQSASSYLLPLSSDDSDYNSEQAAAHLRPKVIRRDTDNILSYYQSEHAGRAYTAADSDSAPAPPIMRKASTDSGSDSEYSSESPDDHFDARPSRSTQHYLAADSERTRRESVPSEGGADRRRLAIVELDSTLPLSLSRKRSQGMRQPGSEGGGAPMTSSIMSRRGVHVDGLALVAPPDASPKTYTDLTPPSTAPLFADRIPSASHGAMHNRSMSEADGAGVPGKLRHQHKRSRDVGIVGMLTSVSEPPGHVGTGGRSEFQVLVRDEGMMTPIFQTPTDSRTPSPGRTTDTSEPTTSSAVDTPISEQGEHEIVTPAIGEGKDISQPVVGPVIVDTSDAIRRGPTRTTTSSMSSPDEAYPMQSTQFYQQHARGSSRYVRYQPVDVHLTAGPLPPPPKPLFHAESTDGLPAGSSTWSARSLAVSRPNTEHDIRALREALQLPKSVSAALASIPTPLSPQRTATTLPATSGRVRQEAVEETGLSRALSKAKSLHRREGAHPPSSATDSPVVPSDEPVELTKSGTEPATEAQTSPTSIVSSVSRASSRKSIDVVPPAPPKDRPLKISRSDLELRRESSWLSLRKKIRGGSPNGKAVYNPSPISHSSSSSLSAHSPTPPPKSGRCSPIDERPAASSGTGSSSNPLKGALSNLKRFSALPRTPSATSSVAKTPSPPSPPPQRLRTPSPPPMLLPKPRPKPRFKSPWPDAMHCRDVTSRKSALERSVGYAEKINELALYDCGLAEWLDMRRGLGPASRASQSRLNLASAPATPASRFLVMQTRHFTGASEASEATFPIRSDAYTATDLTTRPIDVVPTNTPPAALPYPSLASVQPTRAPARSSSIINPSRTILPLAGGGFFSSIGRMKSVKKERPSLPMSSRAPAKRGANVDMASRPVPVAVMTMPTVPGGPRAAPGRIQRSQTFSAMGRSPPNESTPPPSNNNRRLSGTSRRSSIFSRRGAQTQTPVQTPATVHRSLPPFNPEFERQVDRLADILPTADRDILAGYLRRAGQDMLAIGQYLEDERSGNLRRD